MRNSPKVPRARCGAGRVLGRAEEQESGIGRSRYGANVASRKSFHYPSRIFGKRLATCLSAREETK